jgi:hypothetical protein
MGQANHLFGRAGVAMARRRTTVGDEIAKRLDATPAPGSSNRIRAQELKEWAVEDLGDHDDEAGQFPELAGQPRWNLWMMDIRYEDALFAVLIFRPGGAEFFCGTGNAFQIRGFAEGHMADDPDGVLYQMSERFSIPEGSVRLGRRATEKWLGRSW